MLPPIPRERFLGCLLGQAVGDALGAPFEGMPADFVFWTQGPVHELLDDFTPRVLRYTDDTQMMIGVAETLVEHGTIRADTLGARFVANYEAERGYGPGASRILESVAAGGDWDSLALSVFPGGSFGNGAAMRVAPVGLFFARDPKLVGEQARASATLTHRHPWGIEGARLLAVAIALAAQGPPFRRAEFYDALEAGCESEEYRWRVQAARELRNRHSLAFLGNSLPAHQSVVTSIACFTTSLDSFEGVVAKAIAQGDDADTLAAMAGALSGAYLGLDGVPSRWIDRLERGPQGGDYIRTLAERLHERHAAGDFAGGSSSAPAPASATHDSSPPGDRREPPEP